MHWHAAFMARSSKSLDPSAGLGARERQIMDVIFRLGRATAAEVREELPDPPTYSSVRGMLRHLEGKGLLRHEVEGPRFVYLPTSPARAVRNSALSQVVRTFFDDSVSTAVAALIESKPLSEEEYKRLSRLLSEARRKRGET
jgi:BlaI family transcriptional regulator, penicillinase repressor